MNVHVYVTACVCVVCSMYVYVTVLVNNMHMYIHNMYACMSWSPSMYAHTPVCLQAPVCVCA
ncbi:hypothetical protein EON63_18935 [archaeon]|nr:MAG: hypothetical protein EON63_18935 [archaeon]